jgi:hypothetical protein
MEFLMFRSVICTTVLSLVLTACGGGGGATNSSALPNPTSSSSVIVNQNGFIQPITVNNFRFARLDYRYDTPTSSVNKAGVHTTSYEAVTPLIDQIKSIGFNGVVIQLQAPVNAKTGAINDDPTNVKVLPKATWQVVDYAKSQGLKVWISLAIVDSVSDCLLTPDFTKYSEQQMFNNIANYDKPIAALAEKHKVDGIFVSEGNYNFDSESHVYYWQYLISNIKSVYSGKLSYSTPMIQDTPVWNYVDYPSIILSNGLSNTPLNDLKAITKLYHNDIYGIDQVKVLKEIYNKYGKKVILGLASTGADVGVGVVPPDFWGAMFTNFALGATQAKVANTELKSLKVKAFFEIIGLELSDIAIGVSFNEFSPWLQDKNFSDINNPTYQYYCCSWEISNDLTEQKTINSYFGQAWGYHSLITLN